MSKYYLWSLPPVRIFSIYWGTMSFQLLKWK
jgi:hypothetical protein